MVRRVARRGSRGRGRLLRVTAVFLTLLAPLSPAWAGGIWLYEMATPDLASPVRGTSGIDVWCRQGVVLLAGVVPPGPSAGQEAVRLARQTPGVKRVETYFVGARPSWTSDLEIKGVPFEHVR